MQYDGITVHRDWLEQARLMFKSEADVGRALIALLDYALYDKDYSKQSALVRAYVLGLEKRVQAQRKRYSQLQRARTRQTTYTNTNTNTNTYTNTTSAKDELEKKKLLNSIKFLNNEEK